MSTAFIALFLFGLSLLISREFSLVIENLTGNVQVAVYLTDPVNDQTVAHLTETLQKLSAVGDVYANINQSATIVRIDPSSGNVSASVDASEIFAEAAAAGGGVMNGIAYDGEFNSTYLLTGKHWPTLFRGAVRTLGRASRGLRTLVVAAPAIVTESLLT